MRLWRTKCERKGHQWFPGMGSREFIATIDVCLNKGCDEKRVNYPWGECLRGHAIAVHYDDEGRQVATAACPGPI